MTALKAARPVPTEDVKAQLLSRGFAGRDALSILDEAIHDTFRGQIALVSSFGAESAVLLHLVASVAPDLPVLFIDTGKHFAQTPVYRRQLAKRLGLTNVRDLRPDETALREADPDGDLWKRDADACCTLRKVTPLDTALSDYGAWITGRKQFHGGQRLSLPVVEHRGDHFKVNPLVAWTPADVAHHMSAHDLPKHPLVAQGFPSIGCWPCTHPVRDGEDVRDGRWRGAAKTECGIHGRN